MIINHHHPVPVPPRDRGSRDIQARSGQVVMPGPAQAQDSDTGESDMNTSLFISNLGHKKQGKKIAHSH